MGPDVGVTTGVCTLWQQEELVDYTIEVEDVQFKVHKVVMASVSDYFKAMLTGGMVESQTDRVRLKGLEAGAVSSMIELIYTHKFGTTTARVEDLLGCAVYLQIPAAIKRCSELLCQKITSENCFDKYTMFKAYSLKDGVDWMRRYIRSNILNILKVCKPNELSYDAFLLLMDLWGKSEWNLFDSANLWISVDFENRVEHLNDLMSHIRFALMSPEELAAVQDSFTFTAFKGSWCDLVHKAVEYRTLPTHQKVMHDSEQNTVRANLPLSYFFDSPLSFCTVLEEWPLERQLAFKIGDIGLRAGVKALCQEDLLFDCTIKVQGQEFKAHKVVLASVSQYFKAMFGERLQDSNVDDIELKGFSARVVSKLLEFIYTEDVGIIGSDALEVLNCAMYLQMPSVPVQLLNGISDKNCLQVYSALVAYSFNEGTEKVKDYIKVNWNTVLEVCKLEELSRDAFQVLLEYWGKSEWDMFLFIKDWYGGDPENRKDYVTELLRTVRFCLVSPQHTKSITEMDIYNKTVGPWKALVRKAVTYHELPIHLKVLEKSKQCTVRTEPSAVFFNTGSAEDSSTFFALNDNKWFKYEKAAVNTPAFDDDSLPVGVEVNNYFIVCTHGGADQEWHIFDPRTLTWSQIASMPKPKKSFVLVHHAESIYAVGGTYSSQGSHLDVRNLEQYNFKTNSWNSVKKKKLPFTAENHAACVFKDALYVCGGHNLGAEKATCRLYCLNLVSEQVVAVKKATIPHPVMNHVMDVGCIQGQKVLVVVNEYLFIYYYKPATDQWSQLNYATRNDILKMEAHLFGFMVLKGNSLFVVDVQFCEELYDYEDEIHSDDEEEIRRKNFCLRWMIPKSGSRTKDIPTERFPVTQKADDPYMEIFGNVLAFPQ